MSEEPEDSIDLYDRPRSPVSSEDGSWHPSDHEFIDDESPEEFPDLYIRHVPDSQEEEEQEIIWSSEESDDDEVNYDDIL